MTDQSSEDWKAWRREQRRQLLEARNTLPLATRREHTARLVANLDRMLGTQPMRVLGIYWPIKREINLMDWAVALSEQRDVILALPVVTAPRAPLEYWRWRPSDRMTRGVWNIPVPAERTVVNPDVVLAPVVGFQGCWRLGYGGGYFDRTLAARTPRPVAVGIGFDMMETPGFAPEPHDIPMRAVVTESRVIERQG